MFSTYITIYQQYR